MRGLVSRIKHFSLFAAAWMAIYAGGKRLAISRADTHESDRSQERGVSLIAVMPSSAQVAWWIFPATSSRFEDGLKSDLVVIGRRWLLAPGASFDVQCVAIPPAGNIADLLSLDPPVSALPVASFVRKESVRPITLATAFRSGGGPHFDTNTLLLVHGGSDADPAIIQVTVLAF